MGFKTSSPAPTDREHTPELLARMGGRKFVAAITITTGSLILAGLGVISPDQLMDALKWLWGFFFVGAGLARAGGNPGAGGSDQ